MTRDHVIALLAGAVCGTAFGWLLVLEGLW